MKSSMITLNRQNFRMIGCVVAAALAATLSTGAARGQMQITSASRDIEFQLIPNGNGIQEDGSDQTSDLGQWTSVIPFAVQGTGGSVRSLASQTSLIDSSEIAASLIARMEIDNFSEPDYPDGAGSGVVANDLSATFSLFQSTRLTFSVELITNFEDFGQTPRVTASASLTSDSGEIFNLGLQNVTSLIGIHDAMWLPAGSYSLELDTRADLWDDASRPGQSTVNRAQLEFRMFVPEPGRACLQPC
jgi:hypothetical protein